MESYNTYLFEIGFFYSAKFPRPMPVVACVSTLLYHSFLTIYPLKDSWDIVKFWLFQTEKLWTFMYKFLHEVFMSLG